MQCLHLPRQQQKQRREEEEERAPERAHAAHQAWAEASSRPA